jgi:hypothetical protein
MDAPSSRHDEHGSLLDSGDARTVARYLALQRQKKELRGERDLVVLALGRDIGERALAERLDVTQETVGKLLADARGRLNVGFSPTEPMITVGRPGRDPERWAEVDTYYEALGGRPRFSFRDEPSPPS